MVVLTYGYDGYPRHWGEDAWGPDQDVPVQPRIVWLDEIKNLSYNQVPLSHLYQRTFFPTVERRRLGTGHADVAKSLWCSSCGGASYPSHFCKDPSCNVALCVYCAARLYDIPELAQHKGFFFIKHEMHAPLRYPSLSFVTRPTLLIVFVLMDAVSSAALTTQRVRSLDKLCAHMRFCLLVCV
jgi:hypothetical protein